MANTLGNLYSSFRTRLSRFFGDDEEDKIKLQTKPTQSVSFSTRQNQSRRPVKLKLSSNNNPFKNQSNFLGNFSKNLQSFNQNQSLVKQKQQQSYSDFASKIAKTPVKSPKKELIPGGWRAGVERVKTAIKKDPGQFWIGRGFAEAPASARVALTPLVQGLIRGNQINPEGIGNEKLRASIQQMNEQANTRADKYGKRIATDIGYAVRGAGQATPFNSRLAGDKTQQIREQLTGLTPEGEIVEDVGRRAYVTAMFWPALQAAGLTNLLPTLRVAGGTAVNTGMSAATKYAISTNLLSNAAKLVLGNTGLAITDAILGEKYMGKDPKKFASDIALDATLSTLLMSGAEFGVGAFGASKFLNNISFIKNLRGNIQKSMANTITKQWKSIMDKKFIKSLVPNTPINNPEFLAWQEVIGDATKKAMSKGDYGQVINIWNAAEKAPISYIAALGEGTVTPQAITTAMQGSPAIASLVQAVQQTPVAAAPTMLAPTTQGVIPAVQGAIKSATTPALAQGGTIQSVAKTATQAAPKIEAPEKLIQKSMADSSTKQKTLETETSLKNIQTVESDLHNLKLPTDQTAGQPIFDNQTQSMLSQISFALEDEPNLILKLDGKTIQSFEDSGTMVRGIDGEYKEAGQALQEFRFQEQAKKEASLTDTEGQVAEQALTQDVGQQVVDKGITETGQTVQIGDQEVPVGVPGASTDDLASITGESQDIIGGTSIPESGADQISAPLTQAGYEEAMDNIATLLLPSGQKPALTAGTVKVRTRKQAIKALKNLSPGAKVEVFNQLRTKLTPIEMSPPGTPFTVQTGEQARELLAKYPGANILVMNQLPAGQEVINPLSENQIQVMLSENPVEKIEKMIYGSATPTQTELEQGTKAGVGFISNKMRALQEDASSVVGDWVSSSSPVMRNLARGLQGFAGGIGKTSEDVLRKGQFAGGIDYASQLAGDSQRHIYDLIGAKPKTLEKIHAVLDPELAKTKVDFDNLSPKEQQAVGILRTMSDFINDTNYKNGFLSDENWLSNRGGKYIARAYEAYDYPEEVGNLMRQKAHKFDLHPFKKRENLTDWKEVNAIRDPAYLMGKRLQQTLFNDSVVKMSNSLLKTPHVSDVEKPGFIKVSDHKAYGDLAGKYIRKDIMEDIKGFFFTHEAAQKAYDLLSWYDRNPVRQASKKLLTIFNPAVQLGNKTGNYVFAWLSGINPATFTKNKIWATQALKDDDGLVRRMIKDGLLGTDITKADITKMAQELKQGIQNKNILQKIDESVTRHYGKVDDIAKISAMKTWLDRGMSYEESARRTYNGFQNYRTVGWLYNIAAKSPVLGNPFVRFKADLGRILKNAAIDHPFRLGMTLTAWMLFTKAASVLSGENQQDKETREKRIGASRLPFTDISLEFQTPWGAVNAGRLIGPQAFNQPGSSAFLEDVSDFGPFLIPQTSEKTGGKYNITGDPILQPLASLFFDTDFRGKPIADPDKNRYTGSLATAKEKMMNQLKYLGEAYSPPGIDDINRVRNAFLGKKDYYGRTFTPGQSIARLFGVKIEEFGPEQAQERREKDASYQLSAIDRLNKRISTTYNQLGKGEIDQKTAESRVSEFQKEIEGLTQKINDTSIGKTSGDISGITALDKQERKKIGAFLDAGIDVTDQELINYYAGDLSGMGGQTGKDRAKFQQEAFKIVDDVLESDLPDDKKALVLDNLGIEEEDARYYLDAKESKPVRFAQITDVIKDIDNPEEIFNTLLGLKKEVNGKAILTGPVITELYEAGFISAAMKKLLGKYKYNAATGKVELSRSAKTGSVKKPAKFSMSLPKISTPKLSFKMPEIDFGSSAYTPTSVSLKVPESIKPAPLSPSRVKTPTAGAGITPRIRRAVTNLSGLGTI